LKPGTPELLRHRAQVKLGLNAEGQKKFQLSVQHFQLFVDQFPENPAAPEVMMRAAATLEKQLRDPRKASSLYEALASRYQRSPLADDAVVGAARCQEELKDFDRAPSCTVSRGKVPCIEIPARAVAHLHDRNVRAKGKGCRSKLALGRRCRRRRTRSDFPSGWERSTRSENYEAAAQFSNAINSG
jgi:hypothetical protein